MIKIEGEMRNERSIAKATTKLCDGKVALGRSRSTAGFTGTELPRESSVEYKTFPTLSWGQLVDKVDVLTMAPKNLEMVHA